YYTGFVFHVYIASNGEAIASGGRYDTLIAKYGRDIPAAGFAIDEEGLTETQHRER
ncbi:MAG TPA: ATP phosphoribosyltransferase regulatory subunit, partial [Myxococcales bacterium]|nr:ATP phosphoribosyltransferase regulatory subunit [Myxococcales bacterium]